MREGRTLRSGLLLLSDYLKQIACLCFELCVHSNLCVQQPRDRTACFSVVGGSLECLLVCARNLCRNVEMNFADGPSGVELLHSYRSRRVNAFSRQTCAVQLARQRHRKTTGVSCGDKLFGVSPPAFLKTSAERVLSI